MKWLKELFKTEVKTEVKVEKDTREIFAIIIPKTKKYVNDIKERGYITKYELKDLLIKEYVNTDEYIKEFEEKTKIENIIYNGYNQIEITFSNIFAIHIRYDNPYYFTEEQNQVIKRKIKIQKLLEKNR